MKRGELSDARAKDIARKLERWFRLSQRRLPWRESYEPFHIWISEVMLQQTRMERVIGYFERFTARFLDVGSLAAAEIDEVLTLWSGLGYYRRGRQLHSGAREVVNLHGGTLPRNLEDLLKIPGIGRYTAGAILSIGHDLPAPIVDGNVARVLARLEAIEEPLGSPALARVEWRIADRLVNAAESPRMLNQSVMELGALICTPRSPDCGRCPLRDDCLAFANGSVERLPLPRPVRGIRSLEIPLYAIEDGEGKLLMRLESGPLMTGMYHLPHGNELLLPGGSIAVRESKRLGTFLHTVTNRRIEFTVWRASLDGNLLRESAHSWSWIEPREVDRIPHPSYVKKALRFLQAPA